MKAIILVVLIVSVFVVPVNLYAGIIGQDNEDVKACANPIMDNILQGMANDDYIQYSKDFDQELKQSLPKDRFIEKRQGIYDWIGGYLYREYLGFINKEDVTFIFWKGAFDKSKDDILIKLILTDDNGQYSVKGLFYQ